jgi:hypothetical protein
MHGWWSPEAPAGIRGFSYSAPADFASDLEQLLDCEPFDPPRLAERTPSADLLSAVLGGVCERQRRKLEVGHWLEPSAAYSPALPRAQTA